MQTPLQGAFRCVWMENRVFLLMQQAKAYFDRESDTVTPTVNEARSFPTVQNAKRDAKQVRSKGENRTS